MSRGPLWRIGVAGAALVGCATIAALAGDFGLGWDEAVQWRYGNLSLAYFASGFRDRSYAEFLDLRHYGALVEMLAALIARLGGDDPATNLALRHACIASTGLVAVLATACLGRRLGDPLAGAAAGFILAVDPPFFGHAFQNSKDVPFAAGFVLTTLAAARLLSPSRPRLRNSLALGAALGLALSVRIGGLAPLSTVVGCGVAWRLLQRRGDATDSGNAPLAACLLLAIGTAWLGTIAFWPWAHAAPLRHPLESLRTAMAFPVRIPVLFQGAHLPSDDLPARYVPELLLLTTPLPVLACAALGLACSVRAMVARPRARSTLVRVLVVAWLVAPLAAFALARPNLYDGMRHLLFLRPAMALLAGLGAARLVAAPHRRGWGSSPLARAGAKGLVPVLFLLLAAPIADLVRLHPYQATWFNGLAGGVAGAWTRFDTDTGALAYREGMEWIADADPRRPLRVLVAANDYSRPSAERYAPEGVEVQALWAGGIDGALPGSLPSGVDYYLATTRVGLAANFADSPIVHAIGRDGAIFAIVRGRPTPVTAASDDARIP